MTVIAFGDASITHEHPQGLATCRHADGSSYTEAVALRDFLLSINQTRRDCASHGLSVRVRQMIEDHTHECQPQEGGHLARSPADEPAPDAPLDPAAA